MTWASDSSMGKALCPGISLVMDFNPQRPGKGKRRDPTLHTQVTHGLNLGKRSTNLSLKKPYRHINSVWQNCDTTAHLLKWLSPRRQGLDTENPGTLIQC